MDCNGAVKEQRGLTSDAIQHALLRTHHRHVPIREPIKQSPWEDAIPTTAPAAAATTRRATSTTAIPAATVTLISVSTITARHPLTGHTIVTRTLRTTRTCTLTITTSLRPTRTRTVRTASTPTRPLWSNISARPRRQRVH